MKIANLLLVTAATALIATGCYTRREIIHERAGAAPVVREVVVTQAPPTAPVETMGTAPSPKHVWIPGHWSRTGEQWVWSSGRWELRPSDTSVYTPGHWQRTDGGYVWEEGYWK
jgi:hypothetical protein